MSIIRRSGIKQMGIDYKVNKSMFVRLVRNIFSVVAGASVIK
jgi:hypothetical protein